MSIHIMGFDCLRGRDSMSKVGGLGVHKVGGYSH